MYNTSHKITANYSWRFIALLAFVTIAATTSSKQTFAQNLPYKAVVINNDTVVRADIGDIYYVVARLDKGTIVEVDDVLSNWYKITPPTNSYSFVSKAFVNAKGDGKTGQVSTDRVPVKAASAKGIPGESYHRQLYLFKGDLVEIVSEVGSFYKIIPPKGVHVFLPPDSIRPMTKHDTPKKAAATITAEQAAQEKNDPAPKPTAESETQTGSTTAIEQIPTKQPPTTEQKEIPAATETTTPPADSNQDADPKSKKSDTTETAPTKETIVTQADDLVTPADDDNDQIPVRQEIAAAELTITAAMALPLEQQPLDELTKKYQLLQQLPELNQRENNMIRNRLLQLNRNRQLLVAVQLINREKKNAKTEEPVYPDYDFRGILSSSTIYDGAAHVLLYRLVDNDHRRTLAYIHPKTKLDIYHAMGKEIGVFGTTAIDVNTGAKLLIINSYEIIDSQK